MTTRNLWAKALTVLVFQDPSLKAGVGAKPAK